MFWLWNSCVPQFIYQFKGSVFFNLRQNHFVPFLMKSQIGINRLSSTVHLSVQRLCVFHLWHLLTQRSSINWLWNDDFIVVVEWTVLSIQIMPHCMCASHRKICQIPREIFGWNTFTRKQCTAVFHFLMMFGVKMTMIWRKIAWFTRKYSNYSLI